MYVSLGQAVSCTVGRFPLSNTRKPVINNKVILQALYPMYRQIPSRSLAKRNKKRCTFGKGFSIVFRESFIRAFIVVKLKLSPNPAIIITKESVTYFTLLYQISV